MTKNRNFKDGVRAYQAAQAADGRTLTYQQALAEHTARRPARLLPPQRALVLTVPFDAPPRRGRLCPDCNGLGVGAEQLLTETDPDPDGTPRFLAVNLFCTVCLGCGQARHDQCPPASHPAAESYPDEVEELYDDLDEEPEDPCPSCGPHRPGWNVHQTVQPHPDDPELEYVAWVRLPCGHTADRARALPDAEAADLLDGLPDQADPRYPDGWLGSFTGPDTLPFPVNNTFLSADRGRPPVRLHRRRENPDGTPGETVDVFGLTGLDTNTSPPIARYVWLGAGSTADELDAIGDDPTGQTQP